MSKTEETPSRKFGIDAVGNVLWGTHLCQFYETKEDLIDILVPYFTEGLKSNEFCMWVTSPSLGVEEAKQSLKQAVPNIDRYIKNRQIEIIPYTEWYLSHGKFDADRILKGWVEKEKDALNRGFEGLRLTGNTFWVERKLWKTFTDYEAAVNDAIVSHRTLALCTYSLTKCSGNDVIDVIRNHVGTLVKRSTGWTLVEDAWQRKQTEANQLREKRVTETLIDSLPGIFYLFDEKGRFLRWNKNFETVSGYSHDDISNMNPLDFFEGEDKNLIAEKIHEALAKGQSTAEAKFLSKLGSRIPYFFTGNRVTLGQTQCVIGTAIDITERKKTEQALRESQRDLNRAQAVAKTGSWRLDMTRNVLLWSDETYRIFGIPNGKAMTYESFLTAVHPDDREYVDQKWQAALRGEPYDVEHRIVVDGEVRWVRERSELELNKDGVLLGGFGTVQEITEIKEMREKLEEYAKHLEDIVKERTANLRAASLYARSLIEASLDPLVTISAEGKITDVNRATEDVTGYSREQLIGSDFSDYFTEPEKARSGYKQVFTEGYVRDYPLAIRHKSGKIVYVLYDATLYKNESGEIQGVFAAARDVTERMQTQEKLRAAALYARSLIEASLDPLVTISADGKITDVNKSTEEVTGCSREELIGSDFSSYFTEPEKARAGYEKGFIEGFVKDYPLAIRHRSGKITNVLYNATVYRNEAGGIQGVFAAARDVTEREKAQMRIREQAELLDKTHDAITVRDLDNCIRFWNRGAQRLYGWTEVEAVGKKANELFYKKETPASIEIRQTVMEKGEWTGELKQVTKDGKEIIVQSRLTLMRDKKGEPQAILGINTDITEKKKLEAQMLRAQRMESIGTLASGIAHDLNNVLTPIMLSLQLLHTLSKDEATRKTLDILEKNVQRGADLVKQVLLFAKGAGGERKPIQIKQVIDEIDRIMKETFPKSIETRKDISPDLWTISGGATQLHQVIMNLCLNARDAMPNGGNLEISARNIRIDEAYSRMHIDAKIGKYIIINVTDNGVGIAPEIREKIFEPFFTTKERGKGTGLGLSTAMAIVRSHGGFINVYSEVGKGTTFNIYLPVTTAEPETVEVSKPKAMRGQGELILIVEDEASICEITRAILEANGYKSIIANDGAEAIALYTQNQKEVKVVLMDMAMPVMDGSMSIRALRRIDSNVKIVAVSGLDGNGKFASISGFVNAFLAKPYTSERLLKTIDDVLNAK